MIYCCYLKKQLGEESVSHGRMYITKMLNKIYVIQFGVVLCVFFFSVTIY